MLRSLTRRTRAYYSCLLQDGLRHSDHGRVNPLSVEGANAGNHYAITRGRPELAACIGRSELPTLGKTFLQSLQLATVESALEAVSPFEFSHIQRVPVKFCRRD
ncbi:MAG: hypothetical protein HYX27_05150 [Acidobacteria bacterium]|nr:hypothetical protein [Acidobacteriota bacterium]